MDPAERDRIAGELLGRCCCSVGHLRQGTVDEALRMSEAHVMNPIDLRVILGLFVVLGLVLLASRREP